MLRRAQAQQQHTQARRAWFCLVLSGKRRNVHLALARHSSGMGGEGGPYQSSPQKGPCASHRIGSIASHRQLAIARSCPVFAVCLVCRGCQQFWDEAKFASGAPTDQPLCISIPSSPLIIAFVYDIYLSINYPSYHALGAALPSGRVRGQKVRQPRRQEDQENLDQGRRGQRRR